MSRDSRSIDYTVSSAADMPKKCPLCDKWLRTHPTQEDGFFTIECPNCTRYRIDKSLAVLFLSGRFRRSPETAEDRRLRRYLSCKTAITTQQGGTAELLSDSWKKIASEYHEVPFPDKVDLLKNLCRKRASPGQYSFTLKPPKDCFLIHALEIEFDRAVRDLLDRKFLEEIEWPDFLREQYKLYQLTAKTLMELDPDLLAIEALRERLKNCVRSRTVKQSHLAKFTKIDAARISEFTNDKKKLTSSQRSKIQQYLDDECPNASSTDKLA